MQPYPHLARPLAERLAASKALSHRHALRTTLDRELQWDVLQALQTHSAHQSAAVVLDNSTGQVLAYVTSNGGEALPADDDGALVKHAAGGTLKPLLYAEAMDERIVTAATPLETSALAITRVGAARGRRLGEVVDVRTALASALDIPAVRALSLLGVNTFVHSLRTLGFSGLARPSSYGLSLALGSAEVQLVELTNAYRTLANGGMWSEVHFSPDLMSEQAPRRVFSAAATFVIGDILGAPTAPYGWTRGPAILSAGAWAIRTGSRSVFGGAKRFGTK